MRKFYLENEYGQRWNLNRPDTGLLVNPDGLGYEMDAGYSMMGDSFLRTYMQAKQSQVSGSLVFGTQSPYTAFRAFADWTNRAGRLRLIYAPSTAEYYRDVDAVKLDKSEIGKGVLQCRVQFMCRSLFYSDRTNRFAIDRVDGEFRFDFRWPVRFNDYGTRGIRFNNAGHVPAPFEMEIYGYVEYPKVTVKLGNVEQASIRFDTILQVGEKLEYSSLGGASYCHRIDAEGRRENFISHLDIMQTNFFKLPVGESTVEFTSDTGATNKTTMTIYQFYRTV